MNRFLVFLAIGFVVIMGCLFWSQRRPKTTLPINPAVNDLVYDGITLGLTMAQVEAILGQPDVVTTGETVRVENPTFSEYKYGLDEKVDASGRLHVYFGKNEESLRVLFAKDQDRVLAAEYRIGDASVLYKGTGSEKNRQFQVIRAPREAGRDLETRLAAVNAFLQRRTARQSAQPVGVAPELPEAAAAAPTAAEPPPAPVEPPPAIEPPSAMEEPPPAPPEPPPPEPAPPPEEPAATTMEPPPPAADATPPDASPNTPELRTWNDASGKHSIEAVYVKFEKGQVTLRSKDGKRIEIPYQRLSEDDQQYVRTLRNAEK